MNNFSINAYLENRLADGDTLEQIAKELTTALNDANTRYAKAQKEREFKAKRLELATAMKNAVIDYVSFVAPDLNVKESFDIKIEQYAHLVDEVLREMGAVVSEIRTVAAKIKDPIDEFLHKNGLK